MAASDHFYPGFEVAGVESALDRMLTSVVCSVVMAALAIGDHIRDMHARLAAPGEAVFDG